MSQEAHTPSKAQLQRRRELRANYAEMMFGDDTRGRLLRASAAAVARHGTRACTVQHILDEAGLSRRTFYKAFTSLEDALNDLYEVSIKVLRSTMSSAVTRARTPLGRVIAALDTYLELQILGGPLMVALHREAMHDGSPLAVHRRDLLNAYVTLIERELFPIAQVPVDTETARAMICAAEGLVGFGEPDRPFDESDRLRIRNTMIQIMTRCFGIERVEPETSGDARSEASSNAS